jgi:hypothetical protein
MEMARSRSESRNIRAAQRSRERAKARRTRAREARIRRQLSQNTHWTLYVGATMLALGVVALVVAAVLTR